MTEFRRCINYQGVVTQWRLDPTDASGSTMLIDTFTSEPNPYLAAVTPVSSSVLDVRLNQAMLPSGGAFSPTNYTLSGAGQGTLSSNPDTVSLIATTNEPVYRLIWHSGSMNGATTTLAAANALNSRAVPLWSGSSVGFVNSFAQPAVTSFSPAAGKTGASVVIQGTNFTGATSVLFNSVSASFTINNNNQITATVPALATTGPLVVWTPAGNVTTVSNFVVLPPSSDLLVIITNTPNPVTIGSNVMSVITVKNLGPDAAPAVLLTNTLPAGSVLVSAATTQGALATNANVIAASLGTLASNATASVTIVFAPSATGGISATAAANSANADPNTANNTVSLPGFVEPLPLLSVAMGAPGQVNILWSGLLSNWLLQANASLTTSGAWSNVLTTPVVINGTNPTWRIRPWFRLFSGVWRADLPMKGHHCSSKVCVVKTYPLPTRRGACMLLGHYVSAFSGSQKRWQGAHLLECRRKQATPRRARGSTAGALPRRGQRFPARGLAKNSRRSFT